MQRHTYRETGQRNDMQNHVYFSVPALLQGGNIEDIRTGQQHAQTVGHQAVDVVVPEDEGIEIGIRYNPSGGHCHRDSNRYDVCRLFGPVLDGQAEDEDDQGEAQDQEAHDESSAFFPEHHPVQVRNGSQVDRCGPAVGACALIMHDGQSPAGTGGIKPDKMIGVFDRPADHMHVLFHVVTVNQLPVDIYFCIVESKKAQ